MQDGQIPLMAAIEAGNLNVCRELLGYETAAQIKQVDHKRNASLLQKYELRNIKFQPIICYVMLPRYANEPKLDYPLHLAGRKKDNEMVKLFIEAGAAVDAKNVNLT